MGRRRGLRSSKDNPDSGAKEGEIPATKKEKNPMKRLVRKTYEKKKGIYAEKREDSTVVQTRSKASTNPELGEEMEKEPRKRFPSIKDYLKQNGVYAKRNYENPGEEIPGAKKMKIGGEVGDSQAAGTVVEGESSTPKVGGSSTVPETVSKTVVEESTSVVPPVVERAQESEEEEENEPDKQEEEENEQEKEEENESEKQEEEEENETGKESAEATTSVSTEATRSEDQSVRPSENGSESETEVSKKLSGKIGRTRE